MYNELGIIRIRCRNMGMTIQFCEVASRSLMQGKSVGIMSEKENSYIDRIESILLNEFKISITIEKLTRKEPINNMICVYDKGDDLWIDILPQTDVFIGWKITKK